MIPIAIKVDAAQTIALIGFDLKQMPYAMARAINATNEYKQREMQRHVARELNIRPKGAAKLFDEVIRYGAETRADSRAGRLWGQIEILGRGTGATSRAHRQIARILLRQDDAGPQTSLALYRSQANTLSAEGFVIPAADSGFGRTPTRGMDRRLYPAALGLAERRAIEGGHHFAAQYKGGKKRGFGFKKGTAYYFIEQGVGIFERKPETQSKSARQAQRSRSRVPKKFKRGTALYYDNEHIGALSKAMRSGQYARPRREPTNAAHAARGYDDQSSIYTQIWFFQRQIVLPKRVDLIGVYEESLEDFFAVNLDRTYREAVASAR